MKSTFDIFPHHTEAWEGVIARLVFVGSTEDMVKQYICFGALQSCMHVCVHAHKCVQPCAHTCMVYVCKPILIQKQAPWWSGHYDHYDRQIQSSTVVLWFGKYQLIMHFSISTKCWPICTLKFCICSVYIHSTGHLFTEKICRAFNECFVSLK